MAQTTAYDELPDDVYILDDETEMQIKEIGAYVINGVAYGPLTMHFLCNYELDSTVYCDSCDWKTTVGDLPEDSGRAQPPLCPSCLKQGVVSGVRTEVKNAAEETTV